MLGNWRVLANVCPTFVQRLHIFKAFLRIVAIQVRPIHLSAQLVALLIISLNWQLYKQALMAKSPKSWSQMVDSDTVLATEVPIADLQFDSPPMALLEPSFADIMSEQLALDMTFKHVLQHPEETQLEPSTTNLSEFLKEAGISEDNLKDMDQSKFVLQFHAAFTHLMLFSLNFI